MKLQLNNMTKKCYFGSIFNKQMPDVGLPMDGEGKQKQEMVEK